MLVNAWFPIWCGRYVDWCGPHKFRHSRTCVFVFSEVHRTMKRTSCCPQFNKTILFTLLKHGCNFTLFCASSYLRFKFEYCMWGLNVNYCTVNFLKEYKRASLFTLDGFHSLLLWSSRSFKPRSHRVSALMLALTLLNRSRIHLNFATSDDTDADALDWNQCIPFKRQYKS